MMRNIFLTAIAALWICSGYSQNIKDVTIEDFTLELKDNGYLKVDIDINISKLKVKSAQVVVLTPSIVKGKDTLKLKSVGVYGRNRRIFYERNDFNKPTREGDIDIAAAKVGKNVEYQTSVAFMEWMDGCRLELTRTDFGCCDQFKMTGCSELVERFPLEAYTPELVYSKPMHEEAKIRELRGSAFIDFPVSQIVINPSYRNNKAELAKITGTIDSVKNDKDITIKSVSIKGFASPESPYSNNEYLAKGRTEALKEYVESLYHFGKGFIKTDYEPEDWAGLEKYVAESSLPHKEQILEAIRSDREPDKKEWFIKSTWKEEYRYLLENCYPALRHSDYVIEYEIRSFSNTAEIEQVMRTAPQKLSLEEFYYLSKTYEPGSDKFNELFDIAVRMYPDDPVANLNAANSAINRKDYRSAMRFLEKAGDSPEAVYARGMLEYNLKENDAAKRYLEEASKLGVSQAATTLEEMSKNRNIYKMPKK